MPAAFVALALLATACAGSAETTTDSSTTDATAAPETTAAAPDTTAAPETTAASEATAAPAESTTTEAEPTTTETPRDPDSPLNGEFATIGGSSIDLGDLQGKDVVLWFWAPW